MLSVEASEEGEGDCSGIGHTSQQEAGGPRPQGAVCLTQHPGHGSIKGLRALACTPWPAFGLPSAGHSQTLWKGQWHDPRHVAGRSPRGSRDGTTSQWWGRQRTGSCTGALPGQVWGTGGEEESGEMQAGVAGVWCCWWGAVGRRP